MDSTPQPGATDGVLTILFTDVVGSTELATRIGDDAAHTIIEAERRIVREQLAAHGGREIDSIGDGFMIAFVSTRRAVACALAIQEALADHSRAHPAESVRVRIGLNVGEVLQRDGHPFGAAVNAAARIAASAGGGQIVVADAVRQLAGEMQGVVFRDRGRVRLKGFREHWHLYEVVAAPADEGLYRRTLARLLARPHDMVPRNRVLLLAGLLLLTSAIAAAIVVVSLNGNSSPPVAVGPSNSVAVLDARTNRIVNRIEAGLRPISVASGGGSLWIANFGDRTVSRVDARSRRIVSTVSVSGTPVDLVVGEGAVWAANEFEGTVSRIDSATGNVVKNISVGRGPRAIAVGAGSVWVANHVDGTLSRIDPATNEIVTTLGVGAGPTSVAVGAGSVWVANSLEQTVSRIDPRRNPLVVKQIALRFHPYAVAVGEGAVWVTGPDADAVTRIDPDHNRVAATMPAGDGPMGIIAGQGAVFVADSAGGTVSRIDPRRSRIVRRIRVGGSPEALALDRSILWVATSGPRREVPQEAAGFAPRRDGILRLAAINDAFGGLDPQHEFISPSWAFGLFRCCLLRTLLSYSGQPTNKGGAVLRPDLAAGPPEVSPDGRRWTFRVKPGLRYAPPFQETEITSRDIIRAVERTAKVGGLANYFSLIEGFDDLRRGRTDSISGLEAPNGHTLVVHLKRPSGDLGARFALATTAPIPPGAATDDDDYGRFLVASGPYMFEGSKKLDFTAEPRRPVSGHRPGRRVVLVRNPSWRPASDALRPAYVDRIDIAIGGTLHEAEQKIDGGLLDAVLDFNSSHAQVARYRADPARRSRVHSHAADAVVFMSMNLALPPLDDVHVRKAVSLVVNKERYRRIVVSAGASPVIGPIHGDTAGHIVVDSLEDNLLLGYEPYAVPSRRGSVSAARAEMAKSNYDRNRDGVCDESICRHLRAVASSEAGGKALVRLVKRNLASIGLELDVERLDDSSMFRKLADPRQKIGIGMSSGWAKDFPNSSSFIQPLFSRSSLGGRPLLPLVPPNASLVGASPEQLRRWGYRVRTVPNIEAKIEQCLPLVGAAQAQCWAEADQFLVEKIVPVVPLMFLDAVRTVSARVTSYSFDQSTDFPALDRIALRQTKT